MADIAFLLLIFFLVTTTMDIDTGISRILPHMPDGPPPPVPERNVLKILVNKNNRIMVEDKEMDIWQLKDKVKEFVLNPFEDQNLAEKRIKNIEGLGEVTVSKGIISLKNDRATSYKTYIQVQDELAKAYAELRDDFASKHFGLKFSQLNDKAKIKAVQKALPLAISEAEPENTGGL